MSPCVQELNITLQKGKYRNEKIVRTSRPLTIENGVVVEPSEELGAGNGLKIPKLPKNCFWGTYAGLDLWISVVVLVTEGATWLKTPMPSGSHYVVFQFPLHLFRASKIR